MKMIRALITVLVSIYFNTNSAATDYVLGHIDHRIDRVMNSINNFRQIRFFGTTISASDLEAVREIFVKLAERTKSIGGFTEAVSFYFTVLRAEWANNNLIDAIESSLNVHYMFEEMVAPLKRA